MSITRATEVPVRSKPEPELDYYMDPETGFMVFTAHYLAARGFCCDSGCRHCPYDRSKPNG